MAHTSLFDFTRPHRSVNLLTSSGEWDGKIRATTVGTNGMPSYYETYDQNGGVAEFTEQSVLLRDKDLNGTPYNFSMGKQAWGGNYLLNKDGFSASGNEKMFSVVPISTGQPGFGFRIGSINSSIELNGAVSGTVITFSSGTYDPIHMNTRVEVSGSGMLNFATITNVALKSNNEVKIALDRDSNVYGDRSIRLTLSNPYHVPNMVLVGDSGNSPDGFSPGYGRVNYNYNIGQYAITNNQWTNFLNAAASGTDHNKLWNPGMEGISRTGTDYDSYEYTTKSLYYNKPLENVSWEAAAMYCNFLHNSSAEDSRPAYNKMLDGAYDLKSNVKSFNRTPGARYFLPSVNEWYKAAYYNPGGTDTYGRTYIPSGAGYTDFAIMNDDKPSVQEDINIYGDGPQVLDAGLFDRNSFEEVLKLSGHSGADRILWALHAAADRWDNVITLIRDYRHKDSKTQGQYKNSARYMQMKKAYEHNSIINKNSGTLWYGIKLDQVNFYYSSSSVIASCGPVLLALTDDAHNALEPCRQRWMPLTFRLNINTNYINTYSDNDWIEILSHELGHALGIGTLWSRNFGPNQRNPWNSCSSVGGTGSGGGYNSTDLDGDFFINTSKAYNAAIGDGVERRLVPRTGGHFVSSYRDDTSSTDGLEYPGLSNELMQPNYVANSVISTISINNLIDLGYYGHVNYITGEPTLTLANKVGGASVTRIIGPACSCSGQ